MTSDEGLLEDQRDLQLCNFITGTIAVNEFIKLFE